MQNCNYLNSFILRNIINNVRKLSNARSSYILPNYSVQKWCFFYSLKNFLYLINK